MFKVRKINWKGVGWVGRLREMAFLPACVVHLCNTLCSVWEQTGVSVGEIIMTKTNRVAAILLLSAFSHILWVLSITVSFYECSLPQFHSMSALYHGFILWVLSITVSIGEPQREKALWTKLIASQISNEYCLLATIRFSTWQSSLLILECK